jgi:hypothetical protein
MRRLVPVRGAGGASEHQQRECLCQGPRRDARLPNRLHFHCKGAPAQWGCACGPGRRAGAIRDAGGGLVEAYPEQGEGRPPQRGAYFHTGPANLFEEFGFERDRMIAKWRWVMRLRIKR